MGKVSKFGTVTTNNQAAMVTAIVKHSWLPVTNKAGKCTGVEQLSKAKGLTSQQKASYRMDVLSDTQPGDTVYGIKWTSAKVKFTTLETKSSTGTELLEPLTYFEENTASETAGLTDSTGGPAIVRSHATAGTTTLTVNGHLENWYGNHVVSWTKQIIVRSEDGVHISDSSALINFGTLPLWEAQATKEVTNITIGGIQCVKVITTIVWANGFKSVEGSIGAGGYSGSLKVTGNLGANGQVQEEDIVCADGTATHNGQNVPPSGPQPTATVVPAVTRAAA